MQNATTTRAAQNLTEARRALGNQDTDDFAQVATAYALVSIAESLVTMNATFERLADE